ncbi:unnamed protein product [Brassica oleracea]
MTPAKALKKVKGSAFHCSLPPGEIVIGEQNGLPSLLVLLFKSLLSRKDSAWLGNVQNSDSFISDIKREWEYGFAKLQDPEFAFAVSLEPRNNVSVGIQQDLQELMKGCIRLLQAVDSTKEKDVTSAVRKEIRMRLLLACFSSSQIVMGRERRSIAMRIPLGFGGFGLMAMLLSAGAWAPKRGNPWLNLDEAAVEAFGKMCEEIVNVIVETDDESGVPAQRAAISTLEVFASRLPSGHPIFSKCLASVVEGISSKNPGVSSSCLRTT